MVQDGVAWFHDRGMHIPISSQTIQVLADHTHQRGQRWRLNRLCIPPRRSGSFFRLGPRIVGTNGDTMIPLPAVAT
jgi:hypothetical protein